jgi:hypothetical protein
MRGVVKIAIRSLFVLLVGGLAVTSVSRVRNAAQLTRCQDNLRSIGLAFQTHHDCDGHFPTGTLPNADLPPEKRLSWAVQVYPAFMMGGIRTHLDRTRAWDAEGNCPPRCSVRVDSEGHTREELVGDIAVFLCPANPARSEPGLPSPIHYLGIAGVGEAAAELPLSDPRAGFFGYDRKIMRGDIKDGLSVTMVVAEAVDGGPWTAGGRSTVRGLAVDGAPYLGEGGQFASLHRSSAFVPLSQPRVTNVLFADASVRPLTASVSPRVFEALATIAGGEVVAPFGAE